LTLGTLVTLGMEAGELQSQKNFKIAGLTVNIFLNYQSRRTRMKSTGLTMTEIMREGISDGLHQGKINSIVLKCIISTSKAMSTVFSSLSRSTARLAMDMLESSISKDTPLYSLKRRNVDVYDLINVSSTHRFCGPGTPILHNCLGIQYGMSAPGLAVKLTNDTGKLHSEEDAQELINQFDSSYPEFIQWRTEVWDQYLSDGYIKLPCGWTMWGDNHNRRSVQNMPVQGLGASIMRKSVELASVLGLEVIMTLHDAIYVECDTLKTAKSLEALSRSMDEGFKHYFPTSIQHRATCRQDPTVWGPDWKEGQQVVFQDKPIKAYQTYIDERTRSDYEKYRKYFEKYDDLDLL